MIIPAAARYKAVRTPAACAARSEPPLWPAIPELAMKIRKAMPMALPILSVVEAIPEAGND